MASWEMDWPAAMEASAAASAAPSTSVSPKMLGAGLLMSGTSLFSDRTTREPAPYAVAGARTSNTIRSPTSRSATARS